MKLCTILMASGVPADVLTEVIIVKLYLVVISCRKRDLLLEKHSFAFYDFNWNRGMGDLC